MREGEGKGMGRAGVGRAGQDRGGENIREGMGEEVEGGQRRVGCLGKIGRGVWWEKDWGQQLEAMPLIVVGHILWSRLGHHHEDPYHMCYMIK